MYSVHVTCRVSTASYRKLKRNKSILNILSTLWVPLAVHQRKKYILNEQRNIYQPHLKLKDRIRTHVIALRASGANQPSTFLLQTMLEIYLHVYSYIYTPFVPKYLSFSDFKWTTTYGSVCGHILECRFTHFATYVFSGRGQICP